MIVEIVILSFSNPHFVFAQINLEMIDFIFAYFVFLLILPLILYLFKKKLFLPRFAAGRLFLSVLIFIVLIAPLLTPFEPDFYKNINSTKLLSPLTSKSYLVLNEDNNSDGSNIEDFLVLKRRVFNKSGETNIIYFDSLKTADTVSIYQNSEVIKIARDALLLENGTPVVKSSFFILGTDEFGRDIFTRILYGMRLSLFVASGSVILSLLLGLTLGFLAGYYGGWFDVLISRTVDVFLTLPGIFLVILTIALFGNSLINVILVLGLSGWMSLYKIVKGEVISIKNKDYFLTAKKIGLDNRRLFLKEILPVIASPVIINILLQFSSVIIAESALSYLGLGVGLNYPSLGSMINTGQEYFTQAWWISAFPGLTIISIILIFNSIGERINAQLNSRFIQ